ncbi:hypothetical protein M407DRAFT_115399 [Tulasnella calospora MUT 4182]|uniref:Uncharacterized protein n=1 Tax=Tulasnella calospora MUT 4182 TaxID=1051891 RepID=A0A0C3QST1_9AGAM|nr:hypothetical protein M407DRAFT_115399 [Tulasnella calospora MUT 4182]
MSSEERFRSSALDSGKLVHSAETSEFGVGLFYMTSHVGGSIGQNNAVCGQNLSRG